MPFAGFDICPRLNLGVSGSENSTPFSSASSPSGNRRRAVTAASSALMPSISSARRRSSRCAPVLVWTGLGYFNHDQIIATTVVAIVAVASQPMICSTGGRVNLAMTVRRIVMNIIVTISGTATTPFSTALQ